MSTTAAGTPAVLPHTQSSAPRTRRSVARLRRGIELALWLAAVAFAGAIVAGIAGSLLNLVHAGHPNLGSDALVYDDALQIYATHTLYQDPADGYVALLYPPLYPMLLAGLLHLRVWSGWGVVMSSFSGLALAGMVAAVAYRRVSVPQAKLLRIMEAAAIGFVGWWLVTTDPYPGTFENRPDALSWALALGGLLLVPRGLRGSRAALVAAVALLTAAFWTKQPTVAAAIAAGAWALLAVALGVTTRRRAAGFLLALVVGNLVVLGLLNATSDGWASFYIFSLGKRHYWGEFTYGEIFDRSWVILWLPSAAAALMLAAGAFARGRRDRAVSWRAALAADADAQQLALLLSFLIVALPMETYLQRMQGGHENHLVGQLWGLALLVGLGWRWAGRRAATRIVAGSIVAGLGALGLGAGHAGVPVSPGMDHVPLVVAVHRVVDVSPALVALSRHHTVYDQWFSDLGMRGRHVPTSFAACGLTAAALAPTGLERDLATRRYDFVHKIYGFRQNDCSAFGLWEENYFWKLNALVDAGYEPSTTFPGLSERRPGAAAAAAALRLLRCFSPLRAGGALFRIGHGGGFWCQRSPTDPRIVLWETPASLSEVLTDGVVTTIEGALVITVPSGTTSTSVLAVRPGRSAWIARINAVNLRHSARVVVTTGPVHAAAARRALAAGARVKRFDAAVLKGARLSIVVMGGSRVRLDFSGMTIHTKDGILRGAVTRRGLQ
ncbi:MAG: hypothetical protein JWR30_848 [Conexibacter sp.]|nr:hypothetical protein [Conexibacter sp.]